MFVSMQSEEQIVGEMIKKDSVVSVLLVRYQRLQSFRSRLEACRIGARDLFAHTWSAWIAPIAPDLSHSATLTR
jgi:hypothetical protein